MKGPIADQVKPDGLGGYMCARALCTIVLDKIERNRNGTKFTFRHVERHPACLYEPVTVGAR